MRIALIAAVAENGVIGSGNGLPWRLPTDFAYFRQVTLGKPLIMGRKTFEGIGKPLPGRTNVVVTRQQGYQPDGVIVVDDLDAAIEHAHTIAATDGADEIMIGGGGEIYRRMIDQADRLYITHVVASPDGDTRFPTIDPSVWQVIEQPHIVPGERDSADFTVRVYERR
jgi:dihydrofolate reductase